MAATDVFGTVVGTQSFYPFGEQRASTGIFDTERGFTGQIADAATGLNFYNARYQDPVLGRFISPDSIVPDVSNPKLYNRFSYVVNNPVGFTDPSGLVCSYIGEFAGCDSIRGEFSTSFTALANNNDEAGFTVAPSYWSILYSPIRPIVDGGLETIGRNEVNRQAPVRKRIEEIETFRDLDLTFDDPDNTDQLASLTGLAESIQPESGVSVFKRTEFNLPIGPFGAGKGTFLAVDSRGNAIAGEFSQRGGGPALLDLSVDHLDLPSVFELLLPGDGDRYDVFNGAYVSGPLGSESANFLFNVQVLGQIAGVR